MRIERDFKLMRLASLAALILAAALMLAVCLLPQLMMRSLHSRIAPRLASAIEKAHSESVSDALEDIEFIKNDLISRSDLLMILFSHADVMELYRAIRSAEELAPTEESAQLLAELTALEGKLLTMLELNRPSLSNLF